MTERLHFHFSLLCTGEGNGNPLQCYCLENPRDGGAWWAAVYGVTQSWTRLKRLLAAAAADVEAKRLKCMYKGHNYGFFYSFLLVLILISEFSL